MRILVLGAGALGGYFGGRLLKAGRDVTFLVRPGRAAQLAKDGLVVQSRYGDLRIDDPPTVASERISEPFGLVILSCKAYDLESAMASVAPAVGPDTAILPLLNGMSHLKTLDERFGPGRTLGGVAMIGATLRDGAVLHLNDAHGLLFGERDGATSERMEAVTAALTGAGFDARASDAILRDMWEKWVMLASLAAGTSLMRAPVGAIVDAPGGRELMLGLLRETSDIAGAAGDRPGPAAAERISRMLTAPGSPATASMLRDVEGGARTEADHIVGDLIRRGEDAELATPLLRLAYAHLKAYESRRRDTAA